MIHLITSKSGNSIFYRNVQEDSLFKEETSNWRDELNRFWFKQQKYQKRQICPFVKPFTMI